MQFDIFISYAREDRRSAQKLAVALGKQGWSVWWDRVIPAGRNFDDYIGEVIEASQSVVVLWSKHSVASDWVRDEAADGKGRKILVPVLIERSEGWKIPWAYRRIHAADLTRWVDDDDDDAFDSLVTDLARILGPPPQEDQVAAPEPAPKPKQQAKQPRRKAPRIDVPKEQIVDGADYVLIPAGRFKMGAVPGDEQARDDEKPQHLVEITKPFYLKKTPVTVSEYKRFAEETRREMPRPPAFNQGWEKLDHPIVNVSWKDARAYWEWAGGRLPSEAEWEYAARGGKEDSRYPNDNEITKQDAHYGTRDGTVSVGQYPPNGYGLHDMAGNVWEWVADWYQDDYYKKSPQTNPKGPDSVAARVFRGGSWDSNPEDLRVSYREWVRPDVGNDNIGFRCAREVVA